MLPKDDSQQNAELRQAFLKHLPRRIDAVRKRGHRVCRGVWDVNTVTLLYQDVQGLAGAAGRYGLVEASERLYQIERLLDPMIRQLRMPSAEERSNLEAQLEAVATLADPPAPSVRSARDFIVAPPDRPGHHPHGSGLLTPPDEYWRRFSHREVGQLTSATHGAPLPPALAVVVGGGQRDIGSFASAPGEPAIVNAGSLFALDAAHSEERTRAREAPVAVQPAVAEVAVEQAARPAARPRTGRIFYLSDIAPFGRELTQALGQFGYAVDRLESPEELKEMLGSLAPDLILIDAGFFEQIEHLGEFVKRVRQRVSGRLPLLAFADSNDLNARLKAMRSGVDTFIPLPMPAHEAALRVRELVETESENPFKVLIVEDDRAQALFAESVLRKAGMEAQVVSDPLETLDQLERFRPDLVLMDLYMPNITGLELTAIIRERDQFINTPIVFLSGEQDSEKHFEALSAGGDDFLAKPIRPKFLISAVNNRARRARLLTRKRVLDPKDPTTGLYHRSFVIDRLNEMLAHEERAQHPGGVLFIEVDGAHALREQKGLAVHEPVMRQVGAAIASFARPDELAARYGDSSFVLLSGARDAAAMEALARHVAERLGSEPIEVDRHGFRVSARIGLACFAPAIADAADMLNAAERACARARPQDGVRVVVHSAQAVAGGSGLVDAIRRALEEDRFQLLFQPIVSLHSTGEEQYEVLLRLRGDAGEIIGAAEVLEAARGAGLVSAVDRWCLGKCLRVIEERKRAGRPVRLFVNQSVESALDGERIGWLKQILDTRRVPPDALVIELRLGDLLAKLRETMAFFEAVRRLGVRVVIDEFDGGMTALQLLGVVASDYLKLADKYTLNNGTASRPDELRTLVRAAHDGGRLVIAPKVENAQSAATLWTMGVDLIQGNFVQQPGAELGFDFSASAL